jgi:hypothetical protein
MRPLVRHLLVIALVASLLQGCALSHLFSRKGKFPKRAGPKVVQMIGTITMVNAENGFVLIDNGSRPSPTMNSDAQGRSEDGTSAELRVTNVRKRPFVIADIVSGTPRVGDKVFQ